MKFVCGATRVMGIMKLKILFLAGLLLLLPALPVFAAFDKKPEFRWQQLYRSDFNREDHYLYTNRFSAAFNLRDKEEKVFLKLEPFFEIRRNINKDLWERKELGLEIGKDIFKWLYVGQIIQKGWMHEDYRNYADYEKRDYTESETRLLVKHELISSKYIKLKGFAFSEFTYDFDKGQASRNELAVGLTAPLSKYIEAEINWRHIDRIHFYDSDTAEASLTLIF